MSAGLSVAWQWKTPSAATIHALGESKPSESDSVSRGKSMASSTKVKIFLESLWELTGF